MKTTTAFLRSLRTWLRLRVVACALVLAWVGNAIGDQPWQALHGEVGRGDVVPLETILDWLEVHYMGDILEIEIDRDDGLVEYEIKMLGPQGQVVEFEFDGHSGQLMKIEGVRIREMQRNP